MKIMRSIPIAALLALAATIPLAQAGQPIAFHPSTRTAGEVLGLAKGARYALVCTECKGITMGTIGSEKDAAELCHNGGKVHCDGCKKKVTIKTVGAPGKQFVTSKVTYLNSEGKECMFLVPLKEKE